MDLSLVPVCGSALLQTLLCYLQHRETLGSKQLLILWDERSKGWLSWATSFFPGHCEECLDPAKTGNLVHTSSKPRCVISVLPLAVSHKLLQKACVWWLRGNLFCRRNLNLALVCPGLVPYQQHFTFSFSFCLTGCNMLLFFHRADCICACIVHFPVLSKFCLTISPVFGENHRKSLWHRNSLFRAWKDVNMELRERERERDWESYDCLSVSFWFWCDGAYVQSFKLQFIHSLQLNDINQEEAYCEAEPSNTAS